MTPCLSALGFQLSWAAKTCVRRADSKLWSKSGDWFVRFSLEHWALGQTYKYKNMYSPEKQKVVHLRTQVSSWKNS